MYLVSTPLTATLKLLPERTQGSLGIKFHLLVAVLITAGCSFTSTDWVSTQVTNSVTTGISSATWVPNLVTIKYRPDQVDVAAPNFEWIGQIESSIVDSAWYDTLNQYLVIVLAGSAYHYCGFDLRTWNLFSEAPSLGGFYHRNIKGRFDCRHFTVPSYP